MADDYSALKTFILAVAYATGFHLLLVFLHYTGIINVLPGEETLQQWDVSWYKSVKDNGYQFFNAGSNSAFYILFPFIWRITHLNNWGISVVNILFMSGGFALFTQAFPLAKQQKLLLLTIPSLCCAFIPYSEGLFILLSGLLFWAIKNNRRPFIWISLLLLSLTRPVSMILIPAFLAVKLLSDKKENWLRSLSHFFTVYALPLITGQLFFIWYQYHETGVWFAFFKQEKYWGHEFAWPTLPFGSMNGLRYLWLNALGVFCGLVSLLCLLRVGLQWLLKNTVFNDPILLLTYLYILAISLIAMLFNPTWSINATNVYDVHRYVMATPFFWYFIYKNAFKATYSVKQIVLVFVLCNAFWLLFASYIHIQRFLYFNFATALIYIYMPLGNKKNDWLLPVAMAVNILFQLNMYIFFLEGGAIG